MSHDNKELPALDTQFRDAYTKFTNKPVYSDTPGKGITNQWDLIKHKQNYPQLMNPGKDETESKYRMALLDLFRLKYPQRIPELMDLFRQRHMQNLDAEQTRWTNWNRNTQNKLINQERQHLTPRPDAIWWSDPTIGTTRPPRRM